MKLIYIPVIMLLVAVNVVTAQPGQAKERIDAQRVAFITQRLSLTPTEAEKFWPVWM